MIPSVKQWKITFTGKAIVYIDAPTRRLALLNTRHAGYYGSIATIGVMRNPIAVDPSTHAPKKEISNA
jgi:hypothetical protein